MALNSEQRTKIGLCVCIVPRGKRRIYSADFHFGGRHCRLSLKTTVKRIAIQKATELEHQLQNGTLQLSSTTNRKPNMPATINDAIHRFLEFGKTEGLRKKTVTKYRGILEQFAQFAASEGVRTLHDVDLLLVDAYRTHRQPLLAPKSMYHEGAGLKRYFAWCLERGLMPHNPLAARSFSPPPAQPRGGPTLEEIDSILKASSRLRHPVIATAAFAGMRVGEVARLQVQDVDFGGNWLHVVSRPNLETKSGQTWKVPIHPRLRAILEKVLHGKSGWFFTSQPSQKFPQGGHHINPKRVNEDFIAILKSLEIAAGRDSGYTFHSLRSSFKTIAINSGVPRETVDHWQNHAPPRAAGNVYYKLTDEESQRFMRLIPFGDEE